MHINADGCSLAGADIPPGRYFSCRYTYNRLQHLRRGFVELLGAADLLESVQQVVGAQALLFGAREVVDHLAAVHHHDPVAERGRPAASSASPSASSADARDDLARSAG